MKHPFLIIWSCALSAVALAAETESPEEIRAKHKDASVRISEEQDELSADVQQLVVEQTMPKVVELLGEVENIMDEASERLAKADTGGDTIAAQTEILEKIYAAAKEKKGQGNGGKSGGAMMDMMERMMGKKPEGGEPKKGDKPGDMGGGQTGDSDAANEAVNGGAGGKSEARRVPKAAGGAGLGIPEEFQKAFDAYNRGAAKKLK